MGEVLFPCVVQQVTRPRLIDPIFAKNTWAKIIKACQKNEVPDTWAVGDQKTMTINGMDYTVDIIGKNHDDYADGSGKAPLTFQLHDLYGTQYAMHGDGSLGGGWSRCNMRVKHLPAVLSLMPNEVQAGIREVVKTTGDASMSANIVETADKLFLLSEVEVFGTVTFSIQGEGGRYDYYSSENRRKKMQLGSSAAELWWGRTPNNANGVWYCCVGADGKVARSSPAEKLAIAPAFCF